jgi:hypothetical protein
MMNGTAASNGAGHPDGWLSAHELHARFGGSVRTIHRWGESGRIGRYKDQQGRVSFDSEAYARELGKEEELSGEHDSAKLEVARSQVLTSGANDLLKQLLRHNEQMMGPTAEAQRELLVVLKDENKSLREQLASLTAVHLENMKAREELISEAHARTIELKMFEESEARKQAALDMAKGPVKQLLARVVGGAGGDTVPASSGKLAPARALLASLTDDQLAMLIAVPDLRDMLTALLETEVLSDEQKGFVREVLL